MWCDGQLDSPMPTVGCVNWRQVAFFIGIFKPQVELSAQYANQSVLFHFCCCENMTTLTRITTFIF